jgi:hypothetical protein
MPIQDPFPVQLGFAIWLPPKGWTIALVGQSHLASHSDKSREHESNPERRWWVNLVNCRTPSERSSDPNLRPRDRHS